MGQYLTILEVSQKQVYIFQSNKMKDNIEHSAIIEWVMSPKYFEEIVGDGNLFSKDRNIVYSGGGHTVLEFAKESAAERFCNIVTRETMKRYPGLELFAKTVPFQEGESARDNLTHLIEELEKKKSLRRNAFHQGTFGIEAIDGNTLEPKKVLKRESVRTVKEDTYSIPKGYKGVYKFEDLGGSKDGSNFIAVVHIDGNAMGKRIEDLYEEYSGKSWEEMKKILGKFSASIDRDFKAAYSEMVCTVARKLKEDKEKLEGDKGLNQLRLQENYFPVRKIIAAGDDICFVTEGRIGIECAAIFIKALVQKVNEVDHKSYAACAGVAVVHQKYPFYRAYELAEELCSSAKRYGASLSDGGDGRDISCMDWHIEFGEMGDTLSDIRKMYEVRSENMEEPCRLELRPYIVHTSIQDKEQNAERELRSYENFRELIITLIEKDYDMGRGQIKNLRSVLKQGETAVRNYVKFHKLQGDLLNTYYGKYVQLNMGNIGSGEGTELPIFVKVSEREKERRSYLFDAIEMIDTYISLD